MHTVPEKESNISKKMTTKETWTFYFRQLLIFARLSLLYTMSQAHKVVHASVSPPFVQHAASSLVVIQYVTDIFSPKWAILERCAW